MPLVSGPLETLIIAAAACIALVVWLARPPRDSGPRLVVDDGEDGIDREALEAAEREVRELESRRDPEDGFEGDDWGPGAARPRPPVRL